MQMNASEKGMLHLWVYCNWVQYVFEGVVSREMKV